MDLLAATRLVLAVAMLAGAAVLDLRSRRIPNAYWMPFALAAGSLLAVEAGTAEREAFLAGLIAAALLAALAYGGWRLRLFGGADAKAVMVLAALVPAPGPATPASVPLPFALDVVANGTLLATLAPLGLAAWNLARGDVRFPAAFLGVRMPLAKARAAHVWPLERVDAEGRIAWRYWGHVGLDSDTEYDRLEAAGRTDVWVTAKVPLVALLWAGAVLALIAGNLLLTLAGALVG